MGWVRVTKAQKNSRKDAKNEKRTSSWRSLRLCVRVLDNIGEMEETPFPATIPKDKAVARPATR
jgi:hypothetical protein